MWSLEREDQQRRSVAGDRILFGTLQTNAGSFHVGYEIQIVLLFGQDDRLREEYVGRRRGLSVNREIIDEASGSVEFPNTAYGSDYLPCRSDYFSLFWLVC